MYILALNATGRPRGTTTVLVEQALAGAASRGAQTEMVLLAEHDIRFCTGCLTCYQDLEARIAPCSQEDDVRALLEKVAAADGIVLASPLHSGFVTGLMTTFLERATWTLCRPTGTLMEFRGCPEPRLTDKARASVSIVNAGGVPPHLRRFCDTATPWLREMALMLFNGEFVGDMYAAAVFDRPLDEDEGTRTFLLRRLRQEQLDEARALGERLAQAVQRGVRPYDPSMLLGGE